MRETERPRLRIAIDGPSGAGKSTVARAVAGHLGYAYVESGGMYRAVALLACETGADLADGEALSRLAEQARIEFRHGPGGDRLMLNGRDVTDAVRTPEITAASSLVSVHAGVRKCLVERQRALAAGGGVVMEGRDIGTVVLPDAELKVFLDAPADVRAERRLGDADSAGQRSPREVLQAITERDRRDQTRQVSPLAAAPDAVRIDTSSFTAEQVVQQVLELASRRQQNAKRQQEE